MAEYNKDRIRVQIEGKEFSMVGGSFQDMLAAVKQINGRRFVSELKAWQLPGTVEDVQRQLEIGGYRLAGGGAVETPAGPLPSSPTRGEAAGRSDRIRIKVEGRQVSVIGGSFQDMLAAVKNLPGRRFDGEAKIWEIPGELAVVKGMLQSAGFDLEGTEAIRQAPVPPMETPKFSAPNRGSRPSSADGDLFDDNEDLLPFEPPDWDKMPSPPSPPGGWEDELMPPEDNFDDDFEAPASARPKSPTPRPTPARKSGGDRVRIRIGGIPMVVTGGTFQEMVAAIKNLPGRRFDSADKVWDIPDDMTISEVSQRINAAGFAVERD
jgi:hypothetical protein